MQLKQKIVYYAVHDIIETTNSADVSNDPEAFLARRGRRTIFVAQYDDGTRGHKAA
ncbi:MAG: hypothetical protein ACLTHL_07315 [Collinsella sp.]